MSVVCNNIFILFNMIYLYYVLSIVSPSLIDLVLYLEVPGLLFVIICHIVHHDIFVLCFKHSFSIFD
jgi:hypothetical protein